MKLFWQQFVLFSILWIGLILFSSKFIAFHFFLFAVSLALFFLLSFRIKQLYLLFGNILIILCAGFFFSENVLFSAGLVWFLLLLAARQLHTNAYYILLSGAVVTCLLFSFIPSISYALLLGSIFIFVLSFLLHKQWSKDQYYKNLYDKLSDSYRQLKRLHLTAEENAKIEERTRIARDIHDSVGHHLTALIMQIEMLSIKYPDLDLGQMKELANRSLQETRDAVKALKVDETEGIATVVYLIRKLESESHLNVHFTMKNGVLSVPISNIKSVLLYRVIQEGITNAMRHANSREVHVTLSKSADGAIQFEITNAIYEVKAFEPGFGLTNMRSRMEEQDGKLEIIQLPDKFVLSGRIPG
ncbi:sensor histidine kinase [Oceanobacillus neutriphilus]|uniref:histidine kinase n=1 Tax=Oceanobacillus neutriphilus TaxID=531815 RepID=A0ABQ2NS10_9BACI|nr:sensor histidine kinase [Oceanobacillus neutriphilus]GGP09429.1 two-component sensor histidine kinase [Oceanobacillus neutriphilus]